MIRNVARRAMTKSKYLNLTLVKRDFQGNKLLYLMALPVIVYFAIFHYGPMYGLIISFQRFVPAMGISGSKWIGIENFTTFFNSFFAWRIIRNTLLINIYSVIFGFPAPIILALLVSEIRLIRFRRVVQTISYLPHFVSLLVIASIIIDFTASDGLINDIISFFGGERNNLLRQPDLFRTVFVSSDIWQSIGFSSIIYLATISSINPELYEASFMDGAGRFRQSISITLPGIMPTVIILLILKIGTMLSVGFEKIILLYNPSIYETADVISSFVYRKGLLETDYSYAAAVGFFNSVVNFALLLSANMISRKFSETSLW